MACEYFLSRLMIIQVSRFNVCLRKRKIGQTFGFILCIIDVEIRYHRSTIKFGKGNYKYRRKNTALHNVQIDCDLSQCHLSFIWGMQKTWWPNMSLERHWTLVVNIEWSTKADEDSLRIMRMISTKSIGSRFFCAMSCFIVIVGFCFYMVLMWPHKDAMSTQEFIKC